LIEPGVLRAFNMSLDINDTAAVEKRLWDEIESNRFGMLGAAEGVMRVTPMTAFAERESRTLWFFTSKETELADASRRGLSGFFVVMAKDQDLQACMRGELAAVHDVLHVEKYWSPAVAAWFPGGKDDPSLTLMSLTCAEADVWISEVGPIGFGWEIAKANITGTRPKVGSHATLVFSRSATLAKRLEPGQQ